MIGSLSCMSLALQADRKTLEEGLVAAQQHCQATEAANAAGLQNADVSRQELAELQKQLRDARCAQLPPQSTIEPCHV